jgi:alpha-L-fucosidase
MPKWWPAAKVGLFVHFGVYSVPSYRCTDSSLGPLSAEWYWHYLNASVPCIVDYHKRAYGSQFRYESFAPEFRATLFNASEWAQLFEESGARWVVLTSKHHEGYAMWPSAQAWNWNSATNGAGVDFVGSVARAVRARGLKFGVYHSLLEWFNPLYLADVASGFATSVYVDEVLQPMLRDLVERYRPDVVWPDGDWTAPSSYWQSTEFLAWLFNESPVAADVVVGDRWGNDGTNCHDGSFWTCADRYSPGHVEQHPWEDAFTVQRLTWGYARGTPIDQFLTFDELLAELVSTVAFGGNALINVGPSADGSIAPVFQQRLRSLGAWLRTNGDAIYATSPWPAAQNQSTSIYYTQRESIVYAIVLAPYRYGTPIQLSAPRASSATKVQLLGSPASIDSKPTSGGGGISIQFPQEPLPSASALVFSLTNLLNAA